MTKPGDDPYGEYTADKKAAKARERRRDHWERVGPELVKALNEAVDKLHVVGLNLLHSSDTYAKQDGAYLHKVRDQCRKVITEAEKINQEEENHD